MRGVNSKLSARQSQLVRAVMRSIETTGRPPTLRELGAVLGMSKDSTNGVKSVIHPCVIKGYLTYLPLESRSVSPTPEAWAFRPIGRGLSDWRPVAVKFTLTS